MPKELCPLLLAATTTITSKCRKEKCAWWDKVLKACVIMNLSQLQPK